MSVSSQNLGTFQAGGGTATFIVTAPPGCQWTASIPSAESWLTLTPQGGAGPGTVTLTVAANTGGTRTASVTVAGQVFTIAQVCGVASVTLSQTSFNAAGGTAQFNVTALGVCEWTAAAPATWLTLASTRGQGAGTINMNVFANTITTARTGTVTVAGQQFTIEQAAASSGPGVVVRGEKRGR